MKKLIVLIETNFNEMELIYPYYRLLEDYEVHLVGTDQDVAYASAAGLKMKSTHASRDIKAEDYAGLMIPGGFSPDYMRRSPETKALVKAMDEAGKPIAAICHGPWLLASSLDLKGRKLTSFMAIKDDIVHAGANWVDEELVVDKNLFTSRTPADLPALMKAFTKALK
ncbi:MAG TPA: type 1 glutamine amidotransferase domain-containing protein [Clostridia bacterium]|nr:type 1 glutamine amidotransferase domain-containing protein [Clostridia bacterium]